MSVESVVTSPGDSNTLCDFNKGIGEEDCMFCAHFLRNGTSKKCKGFFFFSGVHCQEKDTDYWFNKILDG